MDELTYRVPGMSCGHCAEAVSSEVGKVAGVTGVEVDLDSKTVAVSGAPDDASVRAAIIEAGYEVAEVAEPA